MSLINVLDTQTANLIAAGEVVERPANAVKELVENSIDAHATSVQIEIRGGGSEFIRITDNGKGMSKEDIPLSVKRHATSKIKTSEDLMNISTLGFRGEALAAISSTSRFTIMSKERSAPFGFQFHIEGDNVSEVEECGCADGTTVIVSDLFFNQPARKKFLKREMTEASAVYQYVQRIAISHPEISFKFISNGETKLFTKGDGKLDSCIYSVYGKEFASSICPVNVEKDGLSIYGFVTRPEFSRNTHSYQSFYINKRFVKSKTMQFALEDAYKSFVKSEKYPGCVLFIDMDFSKVDVNVHPAKLEVRFDDERVVYNALYYAIKSSLEKLSNQIVRDEYIREIKEYKKNLEQNKEIIADIEKKDVYVPPIANSVIGEYSEPKKTEIPLFSKAIPKISMHIDEKEIPEKKEVEIHTFDSASFKTFVEEEKKQFSALQIPIDTDENEKNSDFNPVLKKGKISGVIFDAYIIYETEESVYFIDKHAAHERIIYEKIKNSHTRGLCQSLISPVIISLNHSEFSVISEHLDEMKGVGFEMEEFGQNTLILRGIPNEFVSFDKERLTSLIEESAKELSLGGKAQGARDKIFDRVLYSMACKAAVKAGIRSEESDHEWIVQKLRELDNIIVCPHGRPIIAKFTKKQIENLFLRD